MRFLHGHHALRHGQATAALRTPEYAAYINAKGRCNNSRHKQYADYGGRGIQFRFTSFEDFYSELGKRPEGLSLDRVNNDGHYEPGNVKWSTASEQGFNRRPRNLKKAA
jgi:hypothetical protein